ncbi:MAG: calcium/sodium antiporter [Gammaproteobacteria bacterium]|nr:MAG: calcium/sodium antiporter [Gammaproteobacteria bacterium]
MWAEVLAIAGGFVVLAWSADRFVIGASAIAWNLHVSPLIIGLTIVSLGTSAPEILVSGMAALQGNTGLSVGNALGSNIINIGLVLGITALIAPLDVHSRILSRELPVLLLIMGITWLLLLDGTLGRLDGTVLLCGIGVMLTWMAHVGIQSKDTRDPMDKEFAEEIRTGLSMGRAVFWLLVGAVFLLVSSRILVWGAVSMARQLGVSDLIIGLTIVALGTSLPELAASIMGAIKKEHDIVIGNIIGSNIFNLLAVLGLPGVIRPGVIDAAVMERDYIAMVILTVFLFAMAYRYRGGARRINRFHGGVLLLTFIVYQSLLYFSVTGHT